MSMGSMEGRECVQATKMPLWRVETSLHSFRAGLKILPDLSEVGLGRWSGWGPPSSR